MAMRFHHFFEWDPQKAKLNKQKHRVTFEDAQAVLEDAEADLYHVERYDDEHSMGEDRYVTIGSDPADRQIVLFIHWTQRRKGGQTLTRIISARRATPQERRHYAKEISRR
jgi:uncharacterized DUF497 family protein